MSVRIVTDSTADITPEQAQAWGIDVIPLTVFFGDEAYLDHVELDNATFYRRLQSSNSELPRTSQPAPAQFLETYTRLIEEGAESILSLHLSSKLSGTYQSACNARDNLPESLRKVPIEVVDTLSVSGGIALTVEQLAQKAQEGQSLAELKAYAIDRYERTRILAVMDTLEFLRRGGRIGSAKAMLGNMLSVKPIIAIKDGAVTPVEQPRTRTKAFARTAQILAESGPVEALGIVEADAQIGDQFEEVIKTVYKGTITRYKFGPVVGVYGGPGIVGIAYVLANK